MPEKVEKAGVVLVGKKSAMIYAIAITTAFKENEKVVVKARGRAISKAVDAVEIARNRFLADVEIEKITLGTETVSIPVSKDEVRLRNISTIEIVLKS